MRTTVRSAEALTADMRRIVVTSDEFGDFDPTAFSDSYVKVHLPPPGAGYGPDFDGDEIRATRPRAEWPRTRSITVRAWDARKRELTLDFVVHHDDGVAGPWAARARPGDVLHLSGPGGAYAPDPAADWHLLVGDLCVQPAIEVALERIPDGVPVIVVAAEEPNGLEQAVRELELPPGRGQAFVHGEASMVRAVRRHLIVDRGLPESVLSASGYWKQRRTDEQWRADKAEWKRLAAEDVTTAAPPAG